MNSLTDNQSPLFELLSTRLHGILSLPLRKRWSDMHGHMVQVSPRYLAGYLYAPKENGDWPKQTAELVRLAESLLAGEDMLSSLEHRKSHEMEHHPRGPVSHFSFWMKFAV